MLVVNFIFKAKKFVNVVFRVLKIKKENKSKKNNPPERLFGFNKLSNPTNFKASQF